MVHFSKNDFIDPLAKVKRLKATAVPSRFKWTTSSCEQQEEVEQARQALKKLESCRVQAEEATDTASEGKVTFCFLKSLSCSSRKSQTFGEDCDDEVDRLPCLHAFSLGHLVSKCVTKKKEEKLFTNFTGFSSKQRFIETLNFLLPNQDRTKLVYWGTQEAARRSIDMENILDDEGNIQDDDNGMKSQRWEGKQVPSSLQNQSETYSSYKNHATLKCLIGKTKARLHTILAYLLKLF